MKSKRVFTLILPRHVPEPTQVEETKADNIKDAIKSVIKKSQVNDGKQQCRFVL